MEDLTNVIGQKILNLMERAGITTPSQILELSPWELAKLTKCNPSDAQHLRNVTAHHFCSKFSSGLELKTVKERRVSTGVNCIDEILLGGFRCGVITEIYGESSAGKSQLCLQTAINNWEKGAIYICTEDKFPVKRFNQMKELYEAKNSKIDYGKNIFVEHITEAHELLSCIQVRLPNLLRCHQAAVIIIDSIAAPFRCETTNYIQRADDLRELTFLLLKLSQQKDLAILCVNQVTFSSTDDEVMPALGLAWSNVVTNRIHVKKTDKYMTNVNNKELQAIRELTVIFSPEIPYEKAEFVVNVRGVESFM